jgi:HSP20 family protein
MSLFRRTPVLDEFTRMRDEMDRLLSRTFGSNMPSTELGAARIDGWIPPIDVSETDDEILVRTELPGIAVRDLEITITGNTLSIAGKKEEKEETEQEDFYRCERRFGGFRRIVELPESVDSERVSAESDNGLVTIHVAKRPGQRAKRVEVKATTRRVPLPG